MKNNCSRATTISSPARLTARYRNDCRHAVTCHVAHHAMPLRPCHRRQQYGSCCQRHHDAFCSLLSVCRHICHHVTYLVSLRCFAARLHCGVQGMAKDCRRHARRIGSAVFISANIAPSVSYSDIRRRNVITAPPLRAPARRLELAYVERYYATVTGVGRSLAEGRQQPQAARAAYYAAANTTQTNHTDIPKSGRVWARCM